VTPRYRLRTLLILLAVLPPLLWFGWGKYEAWRAERQRMLLEVPDGGVVLLSGPIPPTVDPPGAPPRATEDRPPRGSSDLEHGKGP